MNDPLTDPPPVVPPALALHERSVVLPEGLFLRLIRCYYGAGPNHLGHYDERATMPADPSPEQPAGGGSEGKLANPLTGVTIQSVPPAGGTLIPRGFAAQRAQRLAVAPPTPKE